jgi:hypothetical protein
VASGVSAEVRLYDRLFSDPNPDAGGKDFIEALNPNSLKVVTGYVEPSLATAKPDQKFQFERFGYFVADRVDHVAGLTPVFNRVTGLKDSWGKRFVQNPHSLHTKSRNGHDHCGFFHLDIARNRPLNQRKTSAPISQSRHIFAPKSVQTQGSIRN